MAHAQAAMNGARLAYVVCKLEGEVGREKIVFKETKAGKHKDGSPRITHEMERVTKMEPAGYMVYFPRGHVLRFKDEKKLKQYGLDQKPKIINLQGLNDPNSPIGQLLMMQDEKGRADAYESLEKAVIQISMVASGPIQMPEQISSRRTAARARAVRCSVNVGGDR